jgi:hypothetical protein
MPPGGFYRRELFEGKEYGLVRAETLVALSESRTKPTRRASPRKDDLLGWPPMHSSDYYEVLGLHARRSKLDLESPTPAIGWLKRTPQHSESESSLK